MLNENQILMQLATKEKLIEDILSKLPINITSNNDNKIRFDDFSHSSSAFSMDLTSLTYYNFRENKRGNLIDIIEKYSNKSRTDILTEIYLAIMMLDGVVEVDCADFSRDDYKIEYPESYPTDALEIYPKRIAKLFLDDNIWLTTQDYWGIRYDYKYKRIIIPVYQDGDLVGAIGRLNKLEVKEYENKYMPTLVYNKTRVLFGFDEYKDRIKEMKTVILVESEKSVIKSWQYKLKVPVLAVGCSNVSRHQIERLNLLGVETILWAQDKGIDEESVLEGNLKRLSKYSNAKNIKYLDVDSCELMGDKESLLDKSVEQMKIIINKYVKNIQDYNFCKGGN